MKRKLILVIFASICAFLLGFFTYKCVRKYNKNKQTALIIQKLPKFKFQTLYKTTFDNGNIDTNLPTIIAYFNPNCDFCQKVAENILLNKLDLSKVNFLFVTDAVEKDVYQFVSQYPGIEKANVKILIDTNHTINSCFGLTVVPAFLVYDSQGKLLKKIYGETTMSNILQFTNEQL
jgi:hypothetical protein